MAKLKNQNKRARGESDSDSEDEPEIVLRAWPRFLVVEGRDAEKPLSKLSPFAINHCFKGVSSDITNIKKLKEGAYLVECPSEKASRLLLRRDWTNFVDRPIQVSVHKTLNSCKGVIRCRDLAGLPEDEIQKELENQGVVEVHRVMRKMGETRAPTNTYFLTFATTTLPPKIKVGYLQVSVALFVPSPLQCFKCPP